MKKIISLMLALLTVCVLFTGCGAKKDPDAFNIKIKVDGKGSFEFTTDGSEPKIDPNRLTTEADAQVARGTKVNIVAQPEAPWIFVKWNKDGVENTFQLKKSYLSINLGAGIFFSKHFEVGFVYNIGVSNTGEASWSEARHAISDDTKAKGWSVLGALYF